VPAPLDLAAVKSALYLAQLVKGVIRIKSPATPGDTGTMRIAASVGDGPLSVKFMKSEEAA
jgi:hypothetical protein